MRTRLPNRGMARAPGNPSAFTLIEVVLALVIFVGSIAVISRLLILGGENAQTADWQARAWIVAESQWGEIESGARLMTDSGPFAVDGMPGWQWSFNAEEADLPGLYRVTLRVEEATSSASPRSIELTRLFFDEPVSTSEETAQ